MAATPKLTDRGFVHVHCTSCNNKDVWLRCQTCNKADQFLLEAGTVYCQCDANYQFATCLCEVQVPPNGTLEFVPFEKGPITLADMEVDWTRVGVLGVVVLTILTGAAWFLFGP